jgi:hypothetical protein
LRDDYDKKKSALEQLEYFKTVAEQNAAPTDGHEPVAERSL